MTDKVIVDIDIKELIPSFLQSRKQDVLDLNDALYKNDIKKLKFVSHGLKGTSLSYGFKYMGTLGKTIEQFTQNGELYKIKECIDELDRHMSALDITYTEEV